MPSYDNNNDSNCYSSNNGHKNHQKGWVGPGGTQQ
jgi:hypothetical protein